MGQEIQEFAFDGTETSVIKYHYTQVHLCTGRSLTESDDTRCCINKIWPPDDEQDIARNM
jgi:hypothetical protein